MKRLVVLIVILSALAMLVSCSGGGGSTPPRPITSHSVNLNWAPNHESGVNSTGGGYLVSISGQPTFTVPYTTTTASVALNTGSYTVTVRAYAALDAQGGSTGSTSAASSPLTVNVP